MTKQVFIINGSGGVGKDTVCSAAAQSWKVQNISSITPILQVAKAAGWDGTKTPAARRFLSQLKADCTEFNDLPFRYCTEQLQIFAENDAELLFVHIRDGVAAYAYDAEFLNDGSLEELPAKVHDFLQALIKR